MLSNLIKHLNLKTRYLDSCTLTKNLECFHLLKANVHLSKMDGVLEAAKGWSNPGISNIYESTRPNYNLDSVEFLLERVGALKPQNDADPVIIVELGAGTGKFTRAVLRVFEKHTVRNYRIVATEPLKEMCDKFKEMVPDVEILQRAASDLSGLANDFADFIMAAHCYHWFYSDQDAISEMHRVLKPNGKLSLIWNVPDRSLSWIKNIEEMLDPRFVAMKTPNPYEDTMFNPLRSQGFANEGKDLTRFNYSMEMDLIEVMSRYQGISVIASAQRDDRENILRAIEREMKTNPDTKSKKKYTYKFVVKMNWFEKR